MSYLALARKWRPQQFDQVVGQKHITVTLVNAIKKNRLGHAYLFTGPRGIGKTTLARILAKGINCVSSERPVPNPCDKCDSCLEITRGTSLDVLEIDGASNTGVDDVRQLRENVKYAPSRSRYKIYIIDEVHMLSTNAFNALLKTLEEPPSHVKFFFATTEPNKILDTIVSRCQRFDLKKISRSLITQRLKRIVEAEEVGYEEEALAAIAACGDGSMRDAESILDQMLVYCEGDVRLQDVVEVLGLVPREVLSGFSRAIADEDVTKVIELVREITMEGWNIPQFLSALTAHFRDLLIISVTGRAEGLVDLPDESVEEMEERARRFTAPQLFFILDELTELERTIKFAISEQVALEMTLLKLAQSKRRVYLDNLVERLEELETEGGGCPEGPRPAAGVVELQATEDNAPGPASIDKIWPEFIETLGKNRPILKTYLSEGRPEGIENGVLKVCFDEEFDFHREALESPEKLAYLENLLKNKLGFPVKLKFIVISGKVSSPKEEYGAKEPTSREKKQIVKKNPLIESAIEMFDGTIVDIKE